MSGRLIKCYWEVREGMVLGTRSIGRCIMSLSCGQLQSLLMILSSTERQGRGHEHAIARVWRGQKTTFGTLFSLSTMWVRILNAGHCSWWPGQCLSEGPGCFHLGLKGHLIVKQTRLIPVYDYISVSQDMGYIPL